MKTYLTHLHTLHTAFNGILVARSLVASIMFWRSLFVRLSFKVLSVLIQLTASDYSFGIFKLFL